VKLILDQDGTTSRIELVERPVSGSRARQTKGADETRGGGERGGTYTRTRPLIKGISENNIRLVFGETAGEVPVTAKGKEASDPSASSSAGS